MPRTIAFLILALSACASAPRGAPVAMDGEAPTSVEVASSYRPDGDVYTSFGRSPGVTNSYGKNRVVGPNTSLSRNTQGRWAGTLAGQNVLLEVGEGRIQGAGVELTVVKAAEGFAVSGLWRNARLDLTFGKDRISGTPGGGCSLDLQPAAGNTWRGLFACPATDVAVLQLDGAALDYPEVALPQWLFAFLGTLPEGP